MTLALAFCLVREWRGSLIAPITMHAINNGVLDIAEFLSHKNPLTINGKPAEGRLDRIHFIRRSLRGTPD